MAKTNYRLRDFNYTNAISGALVCMIKNTYNEPEIESTHSSYRGTGICKAYSNNQIAFTCNSVTYIFGNAGTPYSSNAQGLKLMMAEVIDQLSEYGSTAKGTQKIITTRTETGDVSTEIVEGTPDTISIQNLNARDQFALHALKGILSHIESPNSLSANEMSMYCEAAYKWAANMMTESAKVREIFDDESASAEDPKQAEIGILETTEDKLLNNIIVSLQRTSKQVTIDEEDTYVNQVDVTNFPAIIDKMDESNQYLEALKDNVTDAMTNMQGVQTQIVGCLNNIVTQLTLINTSIQSFTSNLNTRMNTLNSNVSSARNDIADVHSDVNTANININNIKTTVNTVNTNLNTVKSDVGIIKQNTTP